ncbi:MAG TPA: hypothetical protein VNK91_10420 [Burkholderiaceae bacterium]|nr:hypothetical protein [Burkholderiaceae bacterium]
MAVNVLLTTPVSIASGNAPFFIYSALQFLPAALVATSLGFALLVALERWLPPKWRGRYGDLLWLLGVAFWIEAAFVADKELHWFGSGSQQSGRLAMLAGLYAAGLLAGVLLLLRWPSQMRRVALFLAAGLAGLTLTQAARTATPYTAQPARDVYAFSGRGDVLVIVLDALQSDLFEELLARRPALRQAFDGFVIYPGTVGVAASTHLTMPAIHGGQVYRDGTSIRALYDAAVREGSFLAALADSGYLVTHVNPILDTCPRGTYWCGHQTTLLDGHLAGYGREFAVLMKLGVARSVPTPLSAAFMTLDEFDPSIHDSVAQGAELLRRFARDAYRDDAAPRAKFLHVMATHAPIRLNERCEPTVGAHWMRADMLRQAECAVVRVAELFSRLKEIGVFERATIVVVSDHGAALPFADPQRRAVHDSRFQAVVGMAAVTFAVKPPAATGAPRFDDAPLQLTDVPTIVCRVSGACGVGGAAATAGSAGPAARRAREFAYYEWFVGRWTRDTMQIPYRFVVDGNHLDPQAWTRVYTTPQPRVVEFKAGAVASGLGFGWSEHHDARGRWTIGRVAQVYTEAVGPAPARLRLELSTHSANQAQWVSVRFNGSEVCSVPVARETTRRECVLPARHSAGRVNDKIELVFAQWEPSPEHAGARLAARVERIEVGAAEQWQ